MQRMDLKYRHTSSHQGIVCYMDHAITDWFWHISDHHRQYSLILGQGLANSISSTFSSLLSCVAAPLTNLLIARLPQKAPPSP